MRIDFGRDEGVAGHLRVGRLLVSVNPDHAHHRPGLHECWAPLYGMDPHKAEQAAKIAEEVVADSIDRHDADTRSIHGCDLVSIPLLERLGESLTDWHLSHWMERFAGVCWPWRGRLWTVAWKAATPPPVDRWKPSAIRRRRDAWLRRIVLGDVPCAPMGVNYDGPSAFEVKRRVGGITR